MHGIYLEDLYVRPRTAAPGSAGRCSRALAAECVERGYARLEWSVLDWNAPSIELLQARSAPSPMDEWTVFRLTDEALTDFADPRSDR